MSAPAIEQPQGEIGGGFDAQERRPQPDAGVAATFDTSGTVTYFNRASHHTDSVQWPNLSPFVQGYVMAMFDGLDHPGYIDVEPGNDDAGHIPVAFSTIAPETLARIMEDCAKGVELSIAPLGRQYNNNAAGGACFHQDRQSGRLTGVGFPPLTFHLGDDGKVRFQ